MKARWLPPSRPAAWMLLWLLALMAPAPGFAAEVVQVTGRTAASPDGEAFLKLTKDEALAAGDHLKASGGEAVEVLEVVGQRARVRVPAKGGLRVGDKLGGSRSQEPKANPLAAKLWKVAPGAVTGASSAAANFDRDRAIWRRLRAAQRTLIVARKQARGQGETGQLRGDITLIGLGLMPTGDSPSWGALRLSNRLQWQGVAGLPLDYRQELSLYLDSIGDGQGGLRARRPLQVRRLELAMAVSPERSVGGRLGRIVVGDGAGGQLVDGAATNLRLGQRVTIEAYGGMGPNLVSMAPQFDVARFGAGATWTGRLFGDQALAALAWGGQLFDGSLDRQLLGSRLHLTLPWVGRVDGQFDAALQQSEPGSAEPPLQPHRGWLGISSPEFWGWRARLRYSYYRALSSRELQATMAWAVLPESRQHDLYLQFDSTRAGGWWWIPALWTGHRAGGDALDGFRLGGTLRAGVTVGRWSWNGSLGAQSPLSSVADAWVGSSMRGASVALGGRFQATDSLALSARLDSHVDEVLPVAVTAWRAGGRLGVDWARGPWLVDVNLGLDKGIDVASPWPANAVEWLDLTLVVRRSF